MTIVHELFREKYGMTTDTSRTLSFYLCFP